MFFFWKLWKPKKTAPSWWMRLRMVIFSQMLFHKMLLNVDAANYSLRTVRQIQPMWICILSHSWSEEAHEEKRNGYFLANVVLQCCWCSKPLSAGSHVSQIAIFFHVPPSLSLHHTPENTKFLHCILLEDEFQNEIPTTFLKEIVFGEQRGCSVTITVTVTNNAYIFTSFDQRRHEKQTHWKLY